uniref:Uncharacterized protein, isoform B n=1 Tax=Drosophila melanogaster TaxID=7227 RepID=M9PG85_DROME|nr:uncharacterized protein Dmel_CG11404, isoform B [Drosophila melanogaster]AGB94905.1 uncharacterized protein Dmel_CG11404, isoform B [Drosophila melanogaster]|eukprot:NP_001262212.1 uncharacterized protein Dmel_CG11404, isoform B [Drosophila melanogaster]
MIFMPALNLLVYNVLVGYISMEINRIINAQTSLWQNIPIIGQMFAPLQPETNYGVEFGESMWDFNLYVNILLLLPAFFQIYHISLLVAIVLMWNCYLHQCLAAFHLKMVWHLWWSDLCWSYYASLVLFGFLLTMLHFSLIIATVMYQMQIDGDPKPRIQSEALPEQQPHPAEEIQERMAMAQTIKI